MLIKEGNNYQQREVSMRCRGLMVKACVGVLIIASALLSGQASSASVNAPQYPQPVLTPAAPAAGDSVSLWLILGQYQNPCSIPYYSRSFSIDSIIVWCAIGPCPARYTITLTYYAAYFDSVPGYCPKIPTEYGPKFSFGNLNPGYYTVIDSMTGKTVTTFTVAPPKNSLHVSGVVSEDNGIIDVQKAVPRCKVFLRDNSLPPVVRCTTCVDMTAKLAKASVVIGTPINVVDSIMDSAVTDAGGRYKFLSVKQGSYMLEFVAAGYQTRTATFTVPPDTVINVSLLTAPAFATIMGTVRETFCTGPNPFNGSICSVSPVPGCTVSVMSISSGLNKKAAADTTFIPALGPYMAVTDNNGSYVIDSFPISYVTRSAIVVVRKYGYASDSKQVSLYPNSAVTGDFMLIKQFSNVKSTTVNGLTFTMATEKQTYQPGEQIRVRYSVINNTMATVTFNSFGCSNFGMFATNPLGDTVCTYPGPIECFALPPPIVLASGDTTSTEFVNFFYYDTLSPLIVTGKVAGYDKTEVAVTVFLSSGGTPVKAPTANHAGVKQPTVSYSSLAKTLYVKIDKPQNLSIAAFGVDGKKIPRLSRSGFFSAGTHALGMSNAACASNIIILRVKGETFSSVQRINLMSSR